MFSRSYVCEELIAHHDFGEVEFGEVCDGMLRSDTWKKWTKFVGEFKITGFIFRIFTQYFIYSK